MWRKLMIWVAAGLLALSAALPVLADQPPGQLGNEGQPGNQGGAQHHP